MDQILVAKPFVRKEGVNYRIIQLTDTAAHTRAKTPTPSLGKKIQKTADNEPGRLYFPVDPFLLTNPREYILSQLQQDADFRKMVQEEEAKGWKVVIALPKDGIPVELGRDAVEFLNSKNGKRLLRGIAKEERKD